MGPRFCKRGNRTDTLDYATAKRMLQWGHAFVSVETFNDTLLLTKEQLLQWGHAFVSVETSIAYARAFASVGLQWGHAFVSVETADSRELEQAFSRASMGPRFCKRGNHTTPTSCDGQRSSFNGATLL